MAAFGGLYIVGGVRYLYYLGLYYGGPVSQWSTYAFVIVCMVISAACLAEICSSLPLSGSIYIWAAEAAGPRTGRFWAFMVAYWTTTAWTSFVASTAEGTANFMLSELVVFGSEFPGGITFENVKFRAVVWICSEAFLAISIASTLMHPHKQRWIFRASALLIAVDFLLTVIWLPIGASKTPDGFRSAEWVFTKYFNGSGAPAGWNVILAFYSTSGTLTGFDAAGHIAEETQNASLASARGMFWSCAMSGLIGWPLLILFLFCSPPLETLFSYNAPQPFVLIYEYALGRGGGLVMTIIAAIGLWINMSLAIVAASRLIYAIARDGILPGSSWIGKLDKNKNPRNAVLFIGIVAALLLCTVLPSTVAFTSLISAAGVPTIAAYATIAWLRLIVTRYDLSGARWTLGKWSLPAAAVTALWNTFLLSVLFSPLVFPVTSTNFNFACVIFGGVSIMAVISWWFVPEDRWLSENLLARVIAGVETRDSDISSADNAPKKTATEPTS